MGCDLSQCSPLLSLLDYHGQEALQSGLEDAANNHTREIRVSCWRWAGGGNHISRWPKASGALWTRAGCHGWDSGWPSPCGGEDGLSALRPGRPPPPAGVRSWTAKHSAVLVTLKSTVGCGHPPTPAGHCPGRVVIEGHARALPGRSSPSRWHGPPPHVTHNGSLK